MVSMVVDQRRAAVDVVAAQQRTNRQEGRKPATDGEVAALLGVSVTAWALARRGKRQPGHRMMRGMMAAFPATIPLLMSFLLPAADTVRHIS